MARDLARIWKRMEFAMRSVHSSECQPLVGLLEQGATFGLPATEAGPSRPTNVQRISLQGPISPDGLAESIIRFPIPL